VHDTTPATSRILVWDLPVRLFHWMLAISFAGAWVTADSERWRDIHILLGYTAGGLVALRVVWGLVGTRHARFASFVRGPRRVIAYLRSLVSDRPEHATGHNPAGAWAIVALLLLTLAIVASGLVVEADAGPKTSTTSTRRSRPRCSSSSASTSLVSSSEASSTARIWSRDDHRAQARCPGEAIGSPRRLVAVALVALVVVSGPACCRRPAFPRTRA